MAKSVPIRAKNHGNHRIPLVLYEAIACGVVIIGRVLAWIFFIVVLVLASRRFFFGYPRPRRAVQLLLPGEVAFLDATAEVMFPSDGAIPVSGLEADLPGYVDRFLASLDGRLRWQIRALMMLVEQATLIFPAPGPGGFGRFSSLSPEQRAAVLKGWNSSPLFLRQLVFTALRAVLTMGYLGHRDVMRFLGVAPYAIESPICEADLLYPAIGAHPDSITLREQDITAPSDGEPIALDAPRHPDFVEGAA